MIMADFYANRFRYGIHLIQLKNADYGAKTDDFANFRKVEKLNIVSTEMGLLVRISDKLSRIETLLSNVDLHVKTESIDDTFIDVLNYLCILDSYIFYGHKNELIHNVADRYQNIFNTIIDDSVCDFSEDVQINMEKIYNLLSELSWAIRDSNNMRSKIKEILVMLAKYWYFISNKTSSEKLLYNVPVFLNNYIK